MCPAEGLLINLSRGTCGGADGHATGQGRVLHVHHVELAVFGDQGRGGERDHAAGADRQQGVYNGPLLVVAFQGGAVEGGPEQPEEHRACSEQIIGFLFVTSGTKPWEVQGRQR